MHFFFMNELPKHARNSKTSAMKVNNEKSVVQTALQSEDVMGPTTSS